MNLEAALRERSSIRAFRSDPVDEATLDKVLDLALASPSWANTQPYRLALATGPLSEILRRELLEASAGTMPSAEHMMLFEYPPELQVRRRATGHGLYAALGIARDDHAGRDAQFRRNFAFFGAPAVAFLFVHEALGAYGVLDAGIFLQSLMLAATSHGLGTCAQASLASYPQIVRRHFDVPEGYKLLCGVAIGVAAEDPVNHFRPGRMSREDLGIEVRSA